MNCEACNKSTERRCPECGRSCCQGCLDAADDLNICCAAQYRAEAIEPVKAFIEEWRTLKPGDAVVVVRPISEMERDLLGRSFTIDRFTKPHGYAVVTDEHGAWHVHPECLTRKETL